MFVLNLSYAEFADRTSRSRELAVVDPDRIVIAMDEPKWLEQLLQLQKDLIRLTYKYASKPPGK
jgi:hypothetical protein